MNTFNSSESEFTRGYQRVEIDQGDHYPAVYEKAPYIESPQVSLSPRLQHAFMKTVGTATYLSIDKNDESNVLEAIG